ncbi:MAG: AAA family ATPase, partial [Planctomycetia bacterium]|nr:AAA family ATPase [Planctomycetia bacterium]
MIIRSVHIDRFGKWNGLRLQNLEGGINLFYGPNETGKTTLMQFLRTIFYGFSEERLAYVYPIEPERTGGKIQILTAQGEFTVTRHLILQKLENEEIRSRGEDGDSGLSEI